MNELNGKHPPPAPFDVWSVLDIWLRRWRWVAMWTVLVAVAGGLVARAVWSLSFSSTAQLIRYEPSSIDDTYHPRALAAPSLVVILQAPGLLEEVGTHMVPPMTGKALAGRLEITLDRNNDVVTVTATGKSRDESIDIVNRYCAAAIAYTQDMQRQEATEVGDNLNRNLVQVEAEIASNRGSMPSMSAASLADLGTGPEAPDATGGLALRIQAARGQLDDLLTRYTDAHPLVIEQRAQLAALEDEGRRSGMTAGGIAAPRPRPASASSMLPLLYGRVTPEEVAMSERVRALETTRALLIERQRSIEPFRDNPPGYFRVLLSAAENPTQLVRYRLQIILFTCLGALVGFLGAAAQVLLAEFLDNRISTRTDVRRITGLPLLATLGDLGRMSPASRERWAFKAWTAVRSRMTMLPGNGLVCGLVSANSGDGRSTWVGLLSRAASSCGFRVLTVTSQPSLELSGDGPRRDSRPLAQVAADPAKPGLPLAPDNVAAPGQVIERLTNADCPPVVNIPLPSWIWDLEHRRQWRSALEAWRKVDHVFILIELPPAFVSESVLLAAGIPNLVWLVDGCRSDASETLTHLETLRQAGCSLVGTVFNRERATPLSGRFSRWLGSAALGFVLVAGLAGPCAARAADAPPPDAPQEAFSASGHAPRAAWQRRLTLGPGDELSFHMVGDPALASEDVQVGPDGRISYLEAENIMAGGLTIDEFRSSLNAELGRFRLSPHAYVTPVAYHSKRYYVLGAVVNKGVFELDHPVTIVEAVARARGFETDASRGDTADVADFSRSFLSRGGHRVPVDFGGLFTRGDLSQNAAIEPGDYLYFSATSGGLIYVLGQVGLPGPVAFDPGVSALSVIVSRGGFTDRAWKAHVLVVRGSLDHPTTFTVDIGRALTGDAPNLALQPGDLVYVADRPWYRAEDLLDNAASAFAESAVVTWTGLNVGPDLFSRPRQ